MILQREKFLNKILNDFFSKDDIKEFSENFINEDKLAAERKNKIGGTKKEQLELKISESSRFRTEIDLLITFSYEKLPKQKYLELLLSLGNFSINYGEFLLAIEIHERILSEAKDNKEFLNLAANAHLALGDLYSRQALWQLSIKNIRKANSIFLQQRDDKGAANCENLLGTIYGDYGDLKRAKEHFEKSISYLDDKTDNNLIGKIEINLGIINNIQGNFDSALNYYRRALLNFQKVSETKRIAEIHHNMGMTFLKKIEYKQALSEFDQSISFSLQAGFLPILGITYVSKAFLYTLMKDYMLAEAFSDKAMEICYKINDKLSIAEIYKVKGIIQRNMSNYELSENLLLTSLRMNKELDNKLNEAETYYELAILYKETNRENESHDSLGKALKYFKKINAINEIKNLEKLF